MSSPPSRRRGSQLPTDLAASFVSRLGRGATFGAAPQVAKRKSPQAHVSPEQLATVEDSPMLRLSLQQYMDDVEGSRDAITSLLRAADAATRCGLERSSGAETCAPPPRPRSAAMLRLACRSSPLASSAYASAHSR